MATTTMYAFRDDGRMVDSLKFIYEDEDYQSLDVRSDDDDYYRFDSEDDFDENAPLYEAAGYKCYYFGDSDDGAMRTNKTTVDIDGETFNFYFEKSGGDKGAGITGEKDDKYYQSGKLLEADSDDKYSVVKAKDVMMTPGIVNSELTPVEYDSEGKVVLEEGEEYTTVYEMLDDAEAFLKDAEEAGYTYLDKSDLETINETNSAKVNQLLEDANINKDLEDLDEVYIFYTGEDGSEEVSAIDTSKYFVVNTSGKVSDSKGRHKDGNDFVYALTTGGDIAGVYVED